MLFEEERKQQISDHIQNTGRASVQELALTFQVSESTVRRDLKDLEESGMVRRTHGGAVALIQADNSEPSYVEKEDRFRLQKEAIAREAAALVREGDTLILDSGTTTYYLAKAIKTIPRLTVVTNSIVVAQELAQQSNISLVLTGGTVRYETLAMVGPMAERALEQLRVDKTFLAINGIDPVAGLTTPSITEAEMKRKMIHAGREVILLADHSKYGKSVFAKVADLKDIDRLIADPLLPETAMKELEEAGVQLTIAAEKGE